MLSILILLGAIVNISCLLISKRKSIRWRFLLHGISLIITASGLIYIKWYYPDSTTAIKSYPLLYHQRNHKGLFDLNDPMQKAAKVHTVHTISGITNTYKRALPFLQKVCISKKGIETNQLLLLLTNNKKATKLMVTYDHHSNSILEISLANTAITFNQLQQLLKENGLLPSKRILYGRPISAPQKTYTTRLSSEKTEKGEKSRLTSCLY
ncbi:hypothetical protein ACFSTE_02550 [Aquimarina hainanensis]|uniref:Uncharacterized protein n=1 Tax=Aquimarina hainanensis TaxID=1578017 RepID=A0ABW5N3V7_9FLAO